MSLRMFTAHITYEVDVMLKTDDMGKPDHIQLDANLLSFGARGTTVSLTPYTGKGEHEFVGSADPGLAHLAICVKCGKRRNDAADSCPGVPK
jgi:hypothetical protein